MAKDKCNLNVIYFPEFENYHLCKGELVVEEKQNNSIGDKIWNGTETTTGVVGNEGKGVYKVGKHVVSLLGKGTYNGL